MRWFRGVWQLGKHKASQIGAVNIYGIPLGTELYSVTLILLALFQIIPEYFSYFGLGFILLIQIIKYLTLLQFTHSKLLLGNYKNSFLGVILYGFWMFMMQWIWFISLFSKPRYEWKEEEKEAYIEKYDNL